MIPSDRLPRPKNEVREAHVHLKDECGEITFTNEYGPLSVSMTTYVQKEVGNHIQDHEIEAEVFDWLLRKMAAMRGYVVCNRDGSLLGPTGSKK